MRLTQSIFFSSPRRSRSPRAGYAADEHIGKDKSKNDPGFNALDKTTTAISRARSGRNPELFKKFKQADKNGDNKLSRMEYLEAMTKQDATTRKNRSSAPRQATTAVRRRLDSNSVVS